MYLQNFQMNQTREWSRGNRSDFVVACIPIYKSLEWKISDHEYLTSKHIHHDKEDSTTHSPKLQLHPEFHESKSILNLSKE